MTSDSMTAVPVASLAELSEDTPTAVRVSGVDLVLVRQGDDVRALYGRCAHRGALMSDGRVDGDLLVCGLHGWRYEIQTGVAPVNPAVTLATFPTRVSDGSVFVDQAAVDAYNRANPQTFDNDGYQGQWIKATNTAEEPFVTQIHQWAAHGLSSEHGPTAAMGVPRDLLPSWESIQLITAQLARLPLLDGEPVNTQTVIGPAARRPLILDIPLFVSDMSFGALSQEAKTALAAGAELAGTGICSGEGGMLPEEQQQNSRYFYELASGRFGWSLDRVRRVQAFHFKGGQGAKTGTGGHLPGNKVTGRIAEVRGLAPGTPAISPARFPDWTSLQPFEELAAQVREESGGIPVGYKMSAQHIERDIDAAVQIGVDYIILDGRGGGTGAAPTIFRDNISVPTIPALARARRHLDRVGADQVSLIITGGLRTPADMVKALALGADAIALSNAALQAIGCVGMRACNTNSCPAGIATQDPRLRARLPVPAGAQRLNRFLRSTIDLMVVLARACGHRNLADFDIDDLVTFDRDFAYLSGVPYAGATPL
ncbi:Rieske 2Fe-2S domain-containing protein [Mycobacterium sp. CBMA293]|uniref:glutamate synthase-related protein n=1 Tax=unclassified Mycolicibacterium TaxID=2636767 RepID=UPI0012DCAC25|nr:MULTISPECIES: glutamate synthase-related protein [unclassified Mycolicibacterium]MUL45240.1 Rieske 2Fe-2S domain-containing protein [Mycolicibacterium sp. CBMA 360]MUL56760.1 Rieske 2Fe-2S domain-containing protein [Mycolicibacterium sp. CBMA 335]MUL69799.1 Rieske 2Fe-2S domain-containing protein [Mycolicibacterium sp. CBMA 311]MUL91847.1 Rieske 2Fe-2S domain-containing protein [Mycolicibacterium sp. CBMA 230]MUM05586.1 glutamate synthase [Mycolicibacterium sp. CBMA 213]